MELDLDFLSKYIAAASPSGYEMELGGQKVWIDYVSKFADRVETDTYGNAYAYYGEYDTHGNQKEKTVLLDAHADEIGFFVFDITDKGFLKIGTLGGSDITIAPSSRVNVWGEKGKVSGVFGHPAIHVHKRKFESKIENVFVDLGVSTKEAVEELGIVVGTPITMVDGYMDLGDFYCGRSLDDKIGGFINSQLLKRLYDEDMHLPFNLVILNAVQEEVGLYGAQMAAQYIKPDVAIAIDVTHDTDSPCYDKNLQGSLSAGEGVVIMTAPSLHKKVVKLMVDTAKANNIPFQRTASGGSSGTNADSYAYPHGIPTGLLKMAMRYMHTTVETVHKADVNSAIELLYHVLKNDNINDNFKY
jgi:putative aminopeptidase FrvX